MYSLWLFSVQVYCAHCLPWRSPNQQRALILNLNSDLFFIYCMIIIGEKSSRTQIIYKDGMIIMVYVFHIRWICLLFALMVSTARVMTQTLSITTIIRLQIAMHFWIHFVFVTFTLVVMCFRLHFWLHAVRRPFHNMKLQRFGSQMIFIYFIWILQNWRYSEATMVKKSDSSHHRRSSFGI